MLTWSPVSTYVESVGSFGVRIFKCPNFDLYEAKAVSPYRVFPILFFALLFKYVQIKLLHEVV